MTQQMYITFNYGKFDKEGKLKARTVVNIFEVSSHTDEAALLKLKSMLNIAFADLERLEGIEATGEEVRELIGTNFKEYWRAHKDEL